jgi:hypothetical protein
MDTATVNGKVYVKASKVADEVGYTADYVGQLCRKGALDAIILGKTWYVAPDGLRAHKEAQTRVNTAATRRNIERQKDELVAQEERRRLLVSARDGQRSRTTDTDIRYSNDTEELLPALHSKHPAVSAYTEPDTVGTQEQEREEVSAYQHDEYPPESPSFPERQNFIHDDEQRDILEEAPEETAIPIRMVPGAERGDDDAFYAGLSDTNANENHWNTERKTLEYSSRDEVADRTEGYEDELTLKKGKRIKKGKVGRSLAPAAILILLVFILASIFLEGRWSYVRGPKQANFYVSYDVASIASVLYAIQNPNFAK